jgi:hypothetical protein
MLIRNLDVNHDWMFGKGLTNYLYDEMALELNIKTRLLEWLNDCFFNLVAGVDYINLLDKGQQDNLTLSIKSVIIKSEGVARLNELNASLNSARNLSLTFSIDTIYGSNFQNIITQELS